MFCSLEAVNDAGIDEAGFYLAGENEKKLEWKILIFRGENSV